MSYSRGPERTQTELLPASIEEYISSNAAVRFIDAFVEELDLISLGLEKSQGRDVGRPGYHPGDMLKLFLYGYLNRIRSSRRLEAETHRNLEVMWLLRRMQPDFKTISDFRCKHHTAFKSVFKQFNLLCRELGLFGAELVAIDGSKFKAVNHPDKYVSVEGLKKLESTIESRIEGYLQALDQADQEAEGSAVVEQKQELQSKIDWWRSKQKQARAERSRLEEAGETSRGLTDSDARPQRRGNDIEVGYNVQLAVDSKHHLIVAQDVVQDANDRGQLSAMAEAAQNALQDTDAGQELGAGQEADAPAALLAVVADAGYHEAGQLEACEQKQIIAYVANQGTTSGQGAHGQPIFPKEAFEYDAATDSYRCPNGQTLPFSYESPSRSKTVRHYKHPSVCRGCELKAQCTSGQFRQLTRLPNEDVVERTAARLEAHPEMMPRRRDIVEHVYGTMRLWGYDDFLLRGLGKVRAEFSLSALAYNMRRVLNLFEVSELLPHMKMVMSR